MHLKNSGARSTTLHAQSWKGEVYLISPAASVSLPAGHAVVFVGRGNCFRKEDSSGTPKDRVSNALQQSAHTETLPFIYNGYVTFPDLKITKHFNRRDFDLLVKWNACYLISLLFIPHIRSSL